MSAITRVQTFSLDVANGGTSPFTGNFGANITAGNLIVGVARAAVGIITAVSVGGDSCTLFKDETTDPAMYLFYKANATGGSSAVSVTASTSGNYTWVWAREYANASTGAPDVGPASKRGTGVTDLVSNAFTTTASGLVVVGVAQNNFATYTVGTDFTLADGALGNQGGDYGGVEDYITSGILSSYTAHITSNISSQYTMVYGAFLDTGGGGGGGTNWGPWVIGPNWNRIVQGME